MPLPRRALRPMNLPSPSSSQNVFPSPSSMALVGSRCSSSIQRRRAWPAWRGAGKLACTEACFSWNLGKRRARPKPCTWSGQVPTVEAMALGRGAWQRSQYPGLCLYTALPEHPCLGLDLCACPCPSRGQLHASPDPLVAVPRAAGLVINNFHMASV